MTQILLWSVPSSEFREPPGNYVCTSTEPQVHSDKQSCHTKAKLDWTRLLDMVALVNITKNPQTSRIHSGDMVKEKSSSNPKFGKWAAVAHKSIFYSTKFMHLSAQTSMNSFWMASFLNSDHWTPSPACLNNGYRTCEDHSLMEHCYE